MATTTPLHFSPSDHGVVNHSGELATRSQVLQMTTHTTLDEVFRRRVRLNPDSLAYMQYDDKKQAWQNYTWKETADEVCLWQSMLRSLHLVQGDRVAIMMNNSREWVIFDQAALGLGLVSVPIYTSDRADNIDRILKDAGCKALLIKGQEQWDTLVDIRSRIQTLDALFSFEVLYDAPSNYRLVKKSLPGFAGILANGLTNADDLATIVYTSGTTGRPKGVMLTHRNILFNTEAGLSAVEVREDDLMLSFLPLSHALERTIGYYLPIVAGSSVAFARSIELLGEDLQYVKPTLLISVPRIYERVHARIEETLASSSAIKQRLFSMAVNVGWHHFLHRQHRAGWSPKLLFHPLLDRLVGAKIRSKLGGRLRFAISGGAPLAPPISRFFISLGIEILQGYGLTETSPVISVNRLEDNEPESVGTPLPGIEVCVGENDELLTRSPCIMAGYWNQPQASAEIMTDDGWLHTGDQVEIGSRGHIRITGRIKDILVLSTGEKIGPSEIEQALSSSQLVEQVLVIGEGHPFLTALVVANKSLLNERMNQDAAPGSTAESVLLEALLPTLHEIPGYVHLGGVAIVDEPFTIENGMMTPTMKLKRKEILANYHSMVEVLYEGH
ncbi:AMP-dependent synthetase/ligase [Solemya velum gill symbiont]|uniref:AMP-dependent synthetase/ligase n=1 Tax=Solemya velum gill symbiont TaxID=2340 RepID=UPI0021194B3E|nr:long-chain fatty acid--CoA ligase [Solemya velum gill symbiont]